MARTDCPVKTLVITVIALILFLPRDVLAQGPLRVIHFPKECSVGKIYIRDWGSTRYGDWREFGDAQGNIRITPDLELRLDSNGNITEIMPLFSTLGPDDIQSLWLGRRRLTDAHLVHLERLTGLKHLCLGWNMNISDEGLVHLQGLSSLEELWLTDTQVTDAGLVHLKELTSLQHIGLDGTRITDEGLVHLRSLPALRILWMANTKVTDAGLAHLKDMASLEELNLYGTEISEKALVILKNMKSLQVLELFAPIEDAGLAHLKDMKTLRVLSVHGTGITDAGLVHLRGLTGLEELDLSNTSISDAGLAHLKTLAKLKNLDLSHTNVTDAGLVHLKGLKNLRELDIRHTGPDGKGIGAVTPGVIELRWVLPRCHFLGFRPTAEIERAINREELGFTILFFVCISPALILLLYFSTIAMRRLVVSVMKWSHSA